MESEHPERSSDSPACGAMGAGCLSTSAFLIGTRRKDSMKGPHAGLIASRTRPGPGPGPVKISWRPEGLFVTWNARKDSDKGQQLPNQNSCPFCFFYQK